MAARIGVGMLGCGFIGAFHSYTFRNLPYVQHKPTLETDLVVIADVDARARGECKARFGWAEEQADWQSLVADPRIDLFINAAPNDLHAEPTVAAASNGKHVFCEKPLGRTGDEAFSLWQAVAATGVIHQCAFSTRFIPALRYARELIKGGELGEVLQFRGAALMSTNLEPEQPMSWRLDKRVAGFGSLGDLGSHYIDIGRYLIREISEVAGMSKTAVPERDGQPVEVEDAFVAIVQFENGVIGTLEGSRIAAGYGHSVRIQVDGTKGSLRFEVERLNEIEIADGIGSGFRTVQVVKPHHPFADFWWRAGMQGSHPIGWVEHFVHQTHHLLAAIAGETEVAPLAATFEDGYRAAEVCDAIARSWQSRCQESVRYRTLDG